MFRKICILIALAALSSCGSKSTEMPRANLNETPSPPIDSPDSTRAIWHNNGDRSQLIYSQSDETSQKVFLTLSCLSQNASRTLRIDRHVRADANARAIMAIVRQREKLRLPVRAAPQTGGPPLWRGEFNLSDPRLDIFTRPGDIHLTIAGAGTLTIGKDPALTNFITACRGV